MIHGEAGHVGGRGEQGIHVHHPLDHEDRLGLTRAPVGRDGDAMGVPHGEGGAKIRDLVWPGDHGGGDQGHHEAARRVGPVIEDHHVRQPEDATRIIDGHLRALDLACRLGHRQAWIIDVGHTNVVGVPGGVS